MSTYEILPCPFCGAPAAEPWFDDEDHGSERGEVYCTGCTCAVQSEHFGWLVNEADRQKAIEEAVSRWNRRAATGAA